jgi:hypothetical protein
MPGVSTQDLIAPHALVIQAAALTGALARALAVAERWLPADGDGVEWTQAWMGLGAAYALLGRPADARAAVERAYGCLAGSGLHHHRAQLDFNTNLMWIVLPYETERIATRRELVERAMANARRASDVMRSAAVEMAWAPIDFIEARWDSPGFTALEAVTMEWDKSLIALSRLILACRDRGQGRRGAAWERVRQIFPAGSRTEPGDLTFSMASELQRVAVALVLDDADLPAAREWLDAHDRWLAWSGAVRGLSEGQALWAQYYRQVGDVQAAQAHAQRACSRQRPAPAAGAPRRPPPPR